MQIDPLALAATGAVQAGPGASSATASAAAPGFGQWFTSELQALNQQMLRAEQGVQRLATGEAANLHDVMIQLEQARLAFQLAIQVRSRVLEAYQDMMRMQL